MYFLLYVRAKLSPYHFIKYKKKKKKKELCEADKSKILKIRWKQKELNGSEHHNFLFSNNV